jgi:RING finger/CHY zinc finger protein 1
MLCPHYTHWMACIHPDTGNVVACRLCYEAETATVFDRFRVRFMKCLFCHVAQPVGTACANPDCTAHGRVHRYYCNICHLWEHHPDHAIFHCDACGICRVGRPEHFRHCDKCQMCVATRRDAHSGMPTDAHQCWGKASDSPCSICFDDLARSHEPASFLTCGHVFHQSCTQAWIGNGGVDCPVCKAPIAVARTSNDDDDENARRLTARDALQMLRAALTHDVPRPPSDATPVDESIVRALHLLEQLRRRRL